MLILPLNSFPQENRAIFMLAKQAQILLSTLHHIWKEHPQTHFAIRSSLLFKVMFSDIGV